MTQSKYAKNIVKNFGLDNASHKRTLVATHLKLYNDENGVDVNQSLYRCIIGSQIYLTTSRPDITYVISVCAWYQANLKSSHLTQLKRILKCISGTYDYGILYSHDSNHILVGYYDIDWAWSAEDIKLLQVDVSFLEKIWYFGSTRGRIMSLYLLLKLNTLLVEAYVLNYSEWNIC